MRRKIDAESLALIKRWEGLETKAYQDGGGVWTIGYGHTGTARPGMVITEAEAERLLRKDLATAEDAVSSLVKVPLTDGQYGALVSFVFNVGAGAFARSTLLKRLNADDYDAVPAQLARWNKDNGRVVPGLVNRRAAEAGLWARGSFVSSAGPTNPKPAVSVNPAAAAAGGVGITAAIATAVEAAPALSMLQGLDWRIGVAVVVAALFAGAIWMMRGRA